MSPRCFTRPEAGLPQAAAAEGLGRALWRAAAGRAAPHGDTSQDPLPERPEPPALPLVCAPGFGAVLASIPALPGNLEKVFINEPLYLVDAKGMKSASCQLAAEVCKRNKAAAN